MKKKQPFEQFDYVSFPADAGSDDIREGFVSRLRTNQVDVVSVRKKDGVNFSDFGLHKKYLEKDRWKEIKHLDLNKDITSWRLYQVIMWAMVRYHHSYGDFMTKFIKPHFETGEKLTEAERIANIIASVRHNTIARDRKANRKV